MEECLDGLNHNICLIYLDDLIVFSKTVDEHFDKLEKIFQRLRDHNLKLTPKKCKFFQEKVQYVGHVVSEKGVEADPEKVDKIVNWPKPSNTDEVRQFLGFAGYYRKFVPNFSATARPLRDLLVGIHNQKKRGRIKRQSNSKDKHTSVPPFVWDKEQQDSFDKLKKILTKPPILGYPEYGKPFILHVDASRNGLGAVLYQCQQGVNRVIAYASRGLSHSEKNYSVHKLEFLSLKWAIVDKFNDYLYGTTFTVFTDNNPLTYILTSAKLDATGHRWLAALACYNFDIKYRPGTTAKDADALSRQSKPDHIQTVTNESIKAISKSCQVHTGCCESLCMATDIASNLTDFKDDVLDTNNTYWRKAQRDDRVIQELIISVGKNRRPSRRHIESCPGLQPFIREFEHFTFRRGILYRKIITNLGEKLQLVLPEKYYDQVLTGLHDNVGHLGRDKTLSLVRERFYWPNMSKFVEQKIKNCWKCTTRKSPTNIRAPLVSITTSQPLKPVTPLSHLEPPVRIELTTPGLQLVTIVQLVTIDYLTLETSKGGYSNILVLTDHFTKYAQAYATVNQTAKTTAKVLFNQFVVHYGFPQRIHSDQGRQFESQLIKELCKIAGIEKSRSSPYHPMGAGCTERMNRTLLNMLGTLELNQKEDWKEYLGPLVHAYNCTRHDTTGFSPYYLMFGRQPRLALDIALKLPKSVMNNDICSTKYIESLKQRLDQAYKLATEMSRKSQAHQKANYDLKVRHSKIEIGDRVLVKAVGFEGKHKIANRWEESPYIVTAQPNTDIPVYEVRQENNQGKPRVLHRNMILPIGSLPILDEGRLEKSTDNTKYKKDTSFKRRGEEVSNCEFNDTDNSDDEVLVLDTIPVQENKVNGEHELGEAELEGSEPEMGDGESDQNVIDSHSGSHSNSHSDRDDSGSSHSESSTERVTPVPVPRRSKRKTPLINPKYKDFVMSQSVGENGADWQERAEFVKTLLLQGSFSKLSSDVSQELIHFVVGK